MACNRRIVLPYTVRDRVSDPAWSYQGTSTTSKRNPLFNCSKERRRLSPHHKLERPQEVRTTSPLQDGGYPNSHRSLQVQTRSKGCLLYGASCTTTPQVLLLSVRREKRLLTCHSVLSIALKSFTKLMKVVASYFRLVSYLDNMLFLNQQKESLIKIWGLVLDISKGLGFLIKKSELSPIWRINLLSFTVDSLSMTISLPEEKIQSTIKKAQVIIAEGNIGKTTSSHDQNFLLNNSSCVFNPLALAWLQRSPISETTSPQIREPCLSLDAHPWKPRMTCSGRHVTFMAQIVNTHWWSPQMHPCKIGGSGWQRKRDATSTTSSSLDPHRPRDPSAENGRRL